MGIVTWMTTAACAALLLSGCVAGTGNAVDHLVDSTVAAGGHNQLPAGQRSTPGQLDGVAAVLGDN